MVLKGLAQVLVSAAICMAALVLAQPGAGAGAGRVESTLVQRTPATGTPDDAISYPAGADQVVLRVETAGGLLPPELILQEMPWFTLYGDGLVIFLGPQPAIAPPPALPNLRRLRLTESGIQAVLRAARDAGLIGEDREFGNQMIADAGTTIFSIAAADRVTTTSVYALGLDPGRGKSDGDRARVLAAAEFAERLRDPAVWLPAEAIAEPEESFAIERLQAVVLPLASTGWTVGPETQVVTWPIKPPLSAFGQPFSDLPDFQGFVPLLPDARCGVVEGEEVATLVAALEQTAQGTVWESDGERFALYPRPLLPDETGCPPRPFGESGIATPAA